MESQGVAQALRQWVAQLLGTLLVATDQVLPHLSQTGTNIGELWLAPSPQCRVLFCCCLLFGHLIAYGTFRGTACASGDLGQCTSMLRQAHNCMCSPEMSRLCAVPSGCAQIGALN